MKKIAISIIVLMLTLTIISPVLTAEACVQESHTSLQHFFSRGRNGTTHHTTYQVRDFYTWTRTQAAFGDNSVSSPRRGQQAHSTAISSVNGWCTHNWALIHG